MSEDAKPRWSVAPYFIVDDVQASADWYRDKLGFAYPRLWGEPPYGFTMVSRAGVTLMLGAVGAPGFIQPNRTAGQDSDAWDAYLWIDDADALHAEFLAKGVAIARPPCDQPYGCRDFEIHDCNGYRLCFGHNLDT
jgi:catechol 2,3-dioxygenase-like lactoylglutathione lyase family enzyme